MSRRTLVNLVVFAVISAVLVVYVALALLFPQGGGRTVRLEVVDATGLADRNDVTMRGVPVGTVRTVELTEDGTASVVIELDPGITVPAGTAAQLQRRSAIGDIVVEMRPGNGPPLPDGGRIRMAELAPDPERTIEVLAEVLRSVPSEDLSTVVAELATALRDRGRDLAVLAEAGADIPEALLEVEAELESLIRTGPKVTGVLADNAGTLADDIEVTAVLADILRDRRFDLLELSRNGARFLTVAGRILVEDKANLSCLVTDLGSVNAVLARPQHLADLKTTLENNHYFFDAIWQSVRLGRDGHDWFRVQLLPFNEPAARPYEPRRRPPDVLGGRACRSIFGRGVQAARQTGPFFTAPGSRLRLGN